MDDRTQTELSRMIDVLTGRSTYTETSLISTGDAALLLGVSEATIKRWTDMGKLPSARTPGGHRKIRLGDVAKYATDNPRHPFQDAMAKAAEVSE